MHEPRRRFHEQLLDLEHEIQLMGVAAERLLEQAVAAIGGNDAELCDLVVASDDEVDGYYLDIERRVMNLFALQTPVARDLRLLTVLLHIDLHLERVADMAVNIAKIVRATWGLPRNPTVVEQLEEMGSIALQMLAAAMDALERRDLDLSQRLTQMDDPIDRLNRGMLKEVLEAASDRAALEWGIGMHVVSRSLERVGDHAVDVGEQVAFLITGEFREFTDASHPEVEHPELLGKAAAS